MNGIGHAKQIHPFKPITEIALCSWLSQAAPGETLEYHRGLLCMDRGGFDTAQKNARSHTLNLLANRAYDLAERGFVHLVQRRIGPDTFSYRAIARPLPQGKAVDSTTLLSRVPD